MIKGFKMKLYPGQGADTAINRKWWDFMADIMETNPDNSPVSVDLQNVFHLTRLA